MAAIQKPIDIASTRQLFIDELFFDQQDNVKLTMHVPQVREVVLVTDKPWEDSIGPRYASVLRDRDVFKMWYRADTGHEHYVTCYAESNDGVHWEKPDLGLVDCRGSRDNNIVELATESSVINASVLLDPNAPPDERFKMVGRNAGGPVGTLDGFLSADGLRWREAQNPLVTKGGQFQAQTCLIWDDEREVYVAYSPLHSGDYGGIHVFRYTESRDFKDWSPPELVLAPDDDDPYLMRLYSPAPVKYHRAARAFLMFPGIMYPDRRYHDEQEMGLDDIQFATSRDGIKWERRFRQPWIRPGLDERNWVHRNPMSTQGILQTGPDELSMFFSELGRSGPPYHRLRRCTLRTDGFVSVEGPYAGWGEFTTPPFTFRGGELEMNYSTSGGGSIMVELQDAGGRPVPGFLLDESDVIFGDKIAGVVRWRDGSDVLALSGQPIRMRIRMRDSDLYAFKFND